MANKTQFSCGAALDIMHLENLKPRIEKAVEKKLPIVFIADKVERMDTSGLQLLLSAVKTIEQQGMTVSWQNPSDALVKACQLFGASSLLKIN